ncbi:MAG: holo-ACP synthase [Candidatus Caldatribacteriaceae bacterium]
MEVLVGVDVVEIERVAKVLRLFGEKFMFRLFAEEEVAFYRGRGRRRWQEGVAALFAGKEAVKKLFLQKGLAPGWRDIRILHSSSGEPQVLLEKNSGVFRRITLSLSHSREIVVAVALGVV